MIFLRRVGTPAWCPRCVDASGRDDLRDETGERASEEKGTRLAKRKFGGNSILSRGIYALHYYISSLVAGIPRNCTNARNRLVVFK